MVKKFYFLFYIQLAKKNDKFYFLNKNKIGKFRVPLMQYLCSSSCSEKLSNKENIISSAESSSDSEDRIDNKRLKKILLG